MKQLVGKALRHSKTFLTKHAADILTAAATIGIVETGIETHKATLRATEFLQANGYDQANPDTQKVLRWESRKNYILPVAIGTATIGMVVGSNLINHKHIAGLAAACTVAETALSEHKGKIEEFLGEKGLGKLEDNINKAHLDDVRLGENDILPKQLSSEDQLCCETYITNKIIWASPEKIRRAINDFNELVNNNTYCSYAEFLDLCGIEVSSDSVAHMIGYNIHQNGLLRVRFTSDIDEATGRTYLAFCPSNPPISNFAEIF